MSRQLERQISSIQEKVEHRHKQHRAKQLQSNSDMAFLAREFVQCTLPHKDPKKRTFKTTNNLITVMIESGTDAKTEKDIGVPYGVIPRLLLYYINTQAVANYDKPEPRRISFGRNLHQFMRELGMNPDNGAGKRSDYKRLVDQARRLFTSKISITFEEPMEPSKSGSNELTIPKRDVPLERDMLISKVRDLWWESDNPYQDSLWESTIVLDEDFYRAITSSPVPVSLRILRQLKRSPLALDLYGWVNYRTYHANAKGKPITIPLRSIHEQLGGSYAVEREFNRKFRQAMAKVIEAQPGLNVEFHDGAVTIHPGQTAIASREE